MINLPSMCVFVLLHNVHTNVQLINFSFFVPIANRRWLGEPILKNNVKELDPRDEAVLSFANSLLKRTLSESFVGISLTDGNLNEGIPMI